MKLIESIKRHPEKYFLPRTEEVLPGEFFTFHDLPNQEIEATSDVDFKGE